MPVRSKAQSRYLNWKFGHEWVKAHHFDQPTKKLPAHVGDHGKAMYNGNFKGKKQRRK